MRPLERGASPTTVDPATGNSVPVAFPTYRHARPHLRKAVGGYCCYCEITLTSTLAVEHIVAKTPSPGLIVTWSNLLLVCNNCNATKNDEVAYTVDLADYFWPDQHPTFSFFTIRMPGRVAVRAGLAPADATRAQATLDLCGLQVDPKHGLSTKQVETESDLRWLRREEVWRIAHADLARLKRGDSRDFRDSILEKAQTTGFLSIWLIAFQNDPQMVQDLIAAFPGTATARLLPLPSPA